MVSATYHRRMWSPPAAPDACARGAPPAGPAEATGEELHPGRAVPAAEHAAAPSGRPQAAGAQQPSYAPSGSQAAAAPAGRASLPPMHVAAAARPQRERDSPEVRPCDSLYIPNAALTPRPRVAFNPVVHVKVCHRRHHDGSC